MIEELDRCLAIHDDHHRHGCIDTDGSLRREGSKQGKYEGEQNHGQALTLGAPCVFAYFSPVVDMDLLVGVG